MQLSFWRDGFFAFGVVGMVRLLDLWLPPVSPLPWWGYVAFTVVGFGVSSIVDTAARDAQ